MKFRLILSEDIEENCAKDQVSIINDLADLGEESNYKSNKPNHPRGYEPGVEWDGSKGYVVTEPLSEAPKDWTAILGVWGLPTDGSVKIVEPIQMRAWDTPCCRSREGLQAMPAPLIE